MFQLGSMAGFAQQSIRGKILNFSDKKPISFVSIALANQRRGYTSDKEGNFEIPSKFVGKSDTLVISSIGYQTLKVPVKAALSQDEFWLSEETKTLDEVIIKNYVNTGTEGSIAENTAYFRSWTTRRNGGEIGRMIYVNSDDYLIERVRLKLNSQCDTCILRLHIRSLTNGLPDRDLLRDSISVIATRHGYDDKYIEFDLRKYNVVVQKSRYVFVSLETLDCFSTTGNCSLAYIGTEQGRYYYRSREDKEWEESAEYGLYLKMFYRY
jgi:hypothetical protein